MVFAMSHPKIRQAMALKLLCLGIKEDIAKPDESIDVETALESK